MWQRLRDHCGQPTFLRRLHGWATLLWLGASVPLAIYFGASVLFVTLISLYAIVTGHWSSWQSARVEVKQDKADDESPSDHQFHLFFS